MQNPPARRSAVLTFSCHGVAIAIRAESPETLERAAGRLPPGSLPARDVPSLRYSLHAAREGRPYRLRTGGRTVARAAALDDLLDALESRLHFDVAVRAEQRLFVHAGVVGLDGRTLLLPGRSRSGKTTLVRELVRAGAVYFSDEYAVVDERGRVHPYPKPLSVRVRGTAARRRVTPGGLGAEVGAEPWPVGLVAAVAHRPGARWDPRALSPGEAVLALLDNTVRARSRPGPALRTLAAAVRGVPALAGPRGGARPAAAALLEVLGRS